MKDFCTINFIFHKLTNLNSTDRYKNLNYVSKKFRICTIKKKNKIVVSENFHRAIWHNQTGMGKEKLVSNSNSLPVQAKNSAEKHTFKMRESVNDEISVLNWETGCGISDSLSVDTFFFINMIQ